MRLRFATAARDTFGSFQNRNFRLFFGGQTISQVGNWLTLIAQTLLVLKLTGSGVMVDQLIARGVDQPYSWTLFAFTCLSAAAIPCYFAAARLLGRRPAAQPV